MKRGTFVLAYALGVILLIISLPFVGIWWLLGAKEPFGNIKDAISDTLYD